MKETFELTAKVRSDMGKGASRRLRRTETVPAIIYGGNSAPQTISLAHNEIIHHLENEAFYSHVLKLDVEGKTEKVVLRDIQRHPYKPVIMHADFLRVNDKTSLTMNVPLHFINEETAIGVKQQGGIVMHLATDVEVTCLAKDLPEYIEVDIANLEVGESIHLSQIQLPAGVELVELSHGDDHDLAIVSINKPRGGGDTEEAAEATSEDVSAKEGE